MARATTRSGNRRAARSPGMRRERDVDGVVCGVDEAGYAPLAGPLVAAAVALPRTARKPRRLHGLTDSKLMTREARLRLYEVIRDFAALGVGVASVEEIDSLNIFHADMLAMQRAVADLGETPDMALVDGRAAPPLACPVEPIVGGDRSCLSIAAASVVAKVTRDAIMRDLARESPGYGWETNVGYGTEAHYLGLLRLGPSIHHRRSFAPLNTLFAGDWRARLAFRFEPIERARRVEELVLLELRQDLHAVFDGEAHHVGVLKHMRVGWRFHAVGYDDECRPHLGAGPFAPCHGTPLEAPQREALVALLLAGAGG